MKQIPLLLIAIAFSVGASAQEPSPSPPVLPAGLPLPALPDNPDPAAQRTLPMWDRIEHLPRGQKIKISYGSGPWNRCRFGGATDVYLFCEPDDDSDQARTRQVDRAAIRDFKFDHDERNGRLIFTGITVGTGLWLGIYSAQKSHADPEAAGVLGGLIGAGMGALVAVPMSCLSGHCVTIPLPPPQPIPYGLGYRIPLRMPARHSLRR
jgi:hypothetical protein